VVHGLCLTDKRVLGLAAPCLALDRRRGFAVVPDPNGPTQVLLVPTRRVSGIESPALLDADSPNYWQDAWESRVWVERRAHHALSREDVAMAINSHNGRTQDQLHIHIDCVRVEVRDALQAHAARLPKVWSRFPVSLFGHRYRALRLDGANLGSRDPFKLLADGDDLARSDMGRETLAVVGASFDGMPGFVVLAARDNSENPEAAAEELMDHSCAVLR